MFASAAEKQSAHPDPKELHAKIGQQALKIDFLAGALGRVAMRAQNDDRQGVRGVNRPGN